MLEHKNLELLRYEFDFSVMGRVIFSEKCDLFVKSVILSGGEKMRELMNRFYYLEGIARGEEMPEEVFQKEDFEFIVGMIDSNTSALFIKMPYEDCDSIIALSHIIIQDTETDDVLWFTVEKPDFSTIDFKAIPRKERKGFKEFLKRNGYLCNIESMPLERTNFGQIENDPDKVMFEIMKLLSPDDPQSEKVNLFALTKQTIK